MAKFKFVITDDGYPNYDQERGLIESIDGELAAVKMCSTEDEVIALAKDADAVIVRLQPFSAKVAASLPKCKAVGRYGIGVDNIDIPACTKYGIAVCNVPDYHMNEVAEHAIALLFSCCRKTAENDKRIRAGEFDIGAKNPIYRIQGKTLGLIGFGKIPQFMINKLKGFELQVLAYDPYLPKEVADKFGVKLVDLDTVLKESDYVSVHAALTKETHHMINEDVLKKMKKTAILINTARGGLVDTNAIVKALKERWINSAGLDVHEQEPLPKDSPLFDIPNVVITDHAGWYSEESSKELQFKAAKGAVEILSKGSSPYCLNPDVLKSEAFKKKI